MKRNRKETSSVEGEYGDTMTGYADIIIEALREERDGLDPFDIYSHSLKTKILSDSNDFRARFVLGYQALLHEVSQVRTQKPEVRSQNSE